MLENGNYLAMINGMPEGKAVEICSVCGGDIYDGEEYYNIEGDIVCKDCLNDWADNKCGKELDNCRYECDGDTDGSEIYATAYILFGERVEFDDLEEWAEDFKVIAEVE